MAWALKVCVTVGVSVGVFVAVGGAGEAVKVGVQVGGRVGRSSAASGVAVCGWAVPVSAAATSRAIWVWLRAVNIAGDTGSIAGPVVIEIGVGVPAQADNKTAAPI